jgi:predicted small lipoprotein YifL
MKRLITAFAVGAAIPTLLTGCGSQGSLVARTPAASSPPSTAGRAPTVASRGRSATAARRRVPITVQSTKQMRADGNVGPSSSVLHPTSCIVTAKTATARGTKGPPADIYNRWGDRIDLYVFTAPQYGFRTGYQIALPFTNKSPTVYGRGRWKVTVPLDARGRPVRCMVAAQPTHDFQGAP